MALSLNAVKPFIFLAEFWFLGLSFYFRFQGDFLSRVSSFLFFVAPLLSRQSSFVLSKGFTVGGRCSGFTQSHSRLLWMVSRRLSHANWNRRSHFSFCSHEGISAMFEVLFYWGGLCVLLIATNNLLITGITWNFLSFGTVLFVSLWMGIILGFYSLRFQANREERNNSL